MRRSLLRITACIAIFVMTACIPKVKAPPPAYTPCCIELKSDEAFAPACWIGEQWWEMFDDQQLSYLVELALQENPGYHTAFDRIDAAQSNADILRSQLYPQITFGGDLVREKLSKTGIIPANGPVPAVPATPRSGIPFYFTQYQLNFNFLYDFDIWGQRRSMLKAALGEVQASIADEAFARLELSVAVASAYLLYQVSLERLKVRDEIAKNRERYLECVRSRAAGNLDSGIAINDAGSELSSAKQALEAVEMDADLLKHQLQALVGGNYCLEPGFNPVGHLPKVPLPNEISLNLISHRPDIISQLWLIESAGHLIDSARAGYYPDFNLTALAAQQTIHLRKLFEARSFYGFLGPAFNLPVFDGGFLDANLSLQGVNYHGAVLEYNDLLIQAVKEVLDGLSRVRHTLRQYQEYQGRDSYLLKNYDLVKSRMVNNLGSILDELGAEVNMLESRDKALVALGNTLQAILSLIKALGGGYESPIYCEGY